MALEAPHPQLVALAGANATDLAWNDLKPILAKRLHAVVAHADATHAAPPTPPASGTPQSNLPLLQQPAPEPESVDAVLQRLLAMLDEFHAPPFTTQRLCELLVDPMRDYKTSTRKLLNALEKLLTVSSTVPTLAPPRSLPGPYQAAVESDLGALVGMGGDADERSAAPMDVENGTGAPLAAQRQADS